MNSKRRKFLKTRPTGARRRFTRSLRCEKLQPRELLAGDFSATSSPEPEPSVFMDVNGDNLVSARDALAVINYLNDDQSELTDAAIADLDVNDDGNVTAVDALQIINYLNLPTDTADASAGMGEDVFMVTKSPTILSGQFAATFSDKEAMLPLDVPGNKELSRPDNLLEAAEVRTLLERASAATPSNDGIIAVVDRNGRILGVRVEDGVSATLKADPKQLAFAIDGAVAKARTAAFFSSNAAPLTSRTIRFISQSTVTQREVESSPTNPVSEFRGPGFVAPIGVGGHFPPEIPFTPQVDLFAIEHQSRDSQTHPGLDGMKGSGDDFELRTRFNVDPQHVPKAAESFFKTWPESYGEQSGSDPSAIPRGIATLPGGVPLYKLTGVASPASDSVNLAGGIGVFYPGEDGFATFEQGFERGVGQTERERTNADKVLEAEFAALVASAGAGITSGMSGFSRNIDDINARLPPLPDFIALSGRIDLVGITLEIYGPTPSRAFPVPGIDRLLQFGRGLGGGVTSGMLMPLNMGGDTSLAGQAVAEGWLVAPHDSPTDPNLKAADVQRIIDTGVAEANRTRAAIRLDINNGFRPGAKTSMVLSVADTNGEVLGLFRMPDATIFSIDVAVAKARNTAYYADAGDLQPVDRVDFNGDGVRDESTVTGSVKNPNGDTLPLGTALTNRSFRFLSEPRFPTGTELEPGVEAGCAARPDLCLEVGPLSMLRLDGINPKTGENLFDTPLPFEVYASKDHASVKAFDAFNVMRNFRDIGDDVVHVQGSIAKEEKERLANQNGVVFFPGSTPLYAADGVTLIGGFGVSGDGVDQDDVVTAAGQVGFAPDQSIRADSFTIGGIRIPFQHFNRNPFAD
ncbi:heme-binding protein [Neorhodopirellula pilleata]|uniref:Dockerin type I repeat protein n=1 Tax=Neorhodopirellula pilleata TaxID=2714738 RepID=A0A5C5ZFX9_9BACT|nr:heme-binding protein [Neorhodopirellula pilleata]TWT86232.1 Dockerin type I repeat protein [Neorhodopirellula pilleata]